MGTCAGKFQQGLGLLEGTDIVMFGQKSIGAIEPDQFHVQDDGNGFIGPVKHGRFAGEMSVFLDFLVGNIDLGPGFSGCPGNRRPGNDFVPGEPRQAAPGVVHEDPLHFPDIVRVPGNDGNPHFQAVEQQYFKRVQAHRAPFGRKTMNPDKIVDFQCPELRDIDTC